MRGREKQRKTDRQTESKIEISVNTALTRSQRRFVTVSFFSKQSSDQIRN